MITKHTKIYIAGHRGMVGSAIWRLLEQKGYDNLIGCSSKELDLKNQNKVQDFFNVQRPDVVIDAAAKVGGILANNDYPYQFLMGYHGFLHVIKASNNANRALDNTPGLCPSVMVLPRQSSLGFYQ